MKKLLILPFLLLLLFACKSRKENVVSEIPGPPLMDTTVVEDVPPPPAVFLTYKRSPCFGMCPVFTLTVFTDGTAVYEGKNFTDRIGSYQSHWEETVLQRVSYVADSIGYFGFEEKYDNDHVTDLPTTTTSILKNDVLKPVSNRYKGPRSLQALYQELDRHIENSQWKPLERN